VYRLIGVRVRRRRVLDLLVEAAFDSVADVPNDHVTWKVPSELAASALEEPLDLDARPGGNKNFAKEAESRDSNLARLVVLAATLIKLECHHRTPNNRGKFPFLIHCGGSKYTEKVDPHQWICLGHSLDGVGQQLQ
jgi:hypothetical protein